METEISQQFSTELPKHQISRTALQFSCPIIGIQTDGWTDRAVSTDILQDVNGSQPATQNQLSWLGKTGEGERKKACTHVHTHTQLRSWISR